jgi:hypothetical protein
LQRFPEKVGIQRLLGSVYADRSLPYRDFGL